MLQTAIFYLLSLACVCAFPWIENRVYRLAAGFLLLVGLNGMSSDPDSILLCTVVWLGACVAVCSFMELAPPEGEGATGRTLRSLVVLLAGGPLLLAMMAIWDFAVRLHGARAETWISLADPSNFADPQFRLGILESLPFYPKAPSIWLLILALWPVAWCGRILARTAPKRHRSLAPALAPIFLALALWPLPILHFLEFWMWQQGLRYPQAQGAATGLALTLLLLGALLTGACLAALYRARVRSHFPETPLAPRG